MNSWYNKVVSDLNNLPLFIDFYTSEFEKACIEINIKGSVEIMLSRLPGITQECFTNLQEIEAVLQFLNIELKKIQRKHFQKYLEHYNRALSSRDVDKYVAGEKEVNDMDLLINEVALLRNKFLAIMKGLESKNYMLGHLVKLKCAGLEDFTI
jgi:hypothetical protein